MDIQGIAVLTVVGLALAAMLYGAVASRASIAAALIALAVMIAAAGGSWYAWAESASLPWTLGYAMTALVAAAVVLRNLLGSRL